MTASAHFLRKLEAFLEPTDEEAAFLARVLEKQQEAAARKTLVAEGEGHAASYVLLDGWSMRHKTLSDGRRQILGVVLPGDLIGLEAHLLDRASASVTTLTRCTVAEFKPAATVRMLAEHPRLASMLLWATAREEAFLGERLVSLGRRPAIDRVAHLFVELYHRLRLVGIADGPVFGAPLNLDEIGDALGLSVVHVSRTIGRMRELGLLERRNHTITIRDLGELERRVEFPGLYIGRRLAAGERFLRARFAREELDDCF
jgi:CRP-like cAMP-binding protein